MDLALSKPVPRWFLFLSKYVTSLLFVALQVGALCVLVFLTLGLRHGAWNFSVFWAVPVLVFVFSLIYCVSVLVAVRTGSTVLSMLAGLAVWGLTLVVQWGEDVTYKLAHILPEAGMQVDFSGEGIGRGRRTRRRSRSMSG